jgi:hypothetical protein
VQLADALRALLPAPARSPREHREAWLARNATLAAAAPVAGANVLPYEPVAAGRSNPLMYGDSNRFTLMVPYSRWLQTRTARIDLSADQIDLQEDEGGAQISMGCDDVLTVTLQDRAGQDSEPRLTFLLRSGQVHQVLSGYHLEKVRILISDFLDLPRPTWERRERKWALEKMT